jgi:hypothetical protein
MGEVFTSGDTRPSDFRRYGAVVEIELEPGQPPQVAQAVRSLLGEQHVANAWWQAGVEETLESQGDATAPPRSTRGAERA